jgi:hypothetical protein
LRIIVRCPFPSRCSLVSLLRRLSIVLHPSFRLMTTSVHSHTIFFISSRKSQNISACPYKMCHAHKYSHLKYTRLWVSLFTVNVHKSLFRFIFRLLGFGRVNNVDDSTFILVNKS